jgi:two-component system response regulator (stage 0 sporulation protein F)
MFIMVNILLVDNYLSIGLLYREVLQDQGHRVFVAMSGKQACRLAQYERIDLVIVDDKLPDSKAEDVLRILKGFQPHIRSILSFSSTLRSTLNAHLWDGIISKTHDFRVLESEVEKLCHQPSSTVSPLVEENEEEEIAPRYGQAT